MGIVDPHDQSDMEESENISRELLLSNKRRPQWDLETLQECGFRKLFSEVDISALVCDEDDRVLYASTLMFLVGAEK